MRPILLKVAIISLATVGSALPAKPIFAGWIRSAQGSVILRAGSVETTISSSKATGRRLFGGNKIRVAKGTAKLLIFGRQTQITAAKGWYTVPSDPKKAPTGQDIYAKYISRAGRTRDAKLPENVWLAETLGELYNPLHPAGLNIAFRLSPTKPSFRAGDQVYVEAQNLGSVPLYLNLIDIDGVAQVVQLPLTSLAGNPLEPNSKWTRIGGPFTLGLPPGRVSDSERFKLIGTAKAVDLSDLQTSNPVRAEIEADPDADPLDYMRRVLAGAKPLEDSGPWTAATLVFDIKKK